MTAIFKTRVHNLKSWGAQLVQTTIDDKAMEVMSQAKDLTTLLQSKLNIDETTSGRFVFYLLLQKIASGLGDELPFKDKSLEQIAYLTKQDLKINGDYIAAHPALMDHLYENLVDQSYRKKYGQFLTPSYVAEFMSNWGAINKYVSVLDPAVGSGIFLDKVAKNIKDSPGADLYGVDIDPLLLNACAMRLALEKVPREYVTLIHDDFLKLNFLEKQFDFIICNPPYLDFHDFDRITTVKTIEHRFGLKLSKLTNIYVLFFVQATSFLKNGGGMAFITPSEFFYTGYGEELKAFLLKNWTIDAFILIDFSKTVFSGALTTSVITLLRKVTPSPQHRVKFIRILNWPIDNQILLDAVSKGVKNEGYYKMYEVLQGSLDPCEKWLAHFGKNEYGDILDKLMPLRHITSVDRGIATGYNDYFILNQSEIEKWGIERRFLRPAIGRASYCVGYDFSHDDFERLREQGEKVFLLNCFEKPSPNLERYIKYGESIRAHERYITKHRSPWYSMEKREPAPILATVFSRKRMRFVLNKAGVLNLTPFHCIYPKFSDRMMIKALLAYLNSNLCKEIQVIKRREYGGGLHKFEPRDLEMLPVLDVTRLKPERVEKLALLFDKLCETARMNPDKEPQIKEEIDTELGKIIKELKVEGVYGSPH
ncbi:MAG: N-6 DNA methylase [Candidatus Bathyarchaeia archaeon]